MAFGNQDELGAAVRYFLCRKWLNSVHGGEDIFMLNANGEI